MHLLHEIRELQMRLLKSEWKNVQLLVFFFVCIIQDLFQVFHSLIQRDKEVFPRPGSHDKILRFKTDSGELKMQMEGLEKTLNRQEQIQ